MDGTDPLPDDSEWTIDPYARKPSFIQKLGGVIKDEVQGVYARHPPEKPKPKRKYYIVQDERVIRPPESGLIKWR
jgi:hypothetical protein